ncbi:hypothetical protein F4808DRAFT_439198 [Astrocystis sublimbata]|nr:hypothetical protein F4808DRAFT_439198 [Astrocystis sublimbata]
MSRLPIKIQIGIRDVWEREDAPVQKAIRNLKDVTGVDVTVDPEWPLLLSELDNFYPDKATLVPSVASAVEAFCVALSTLADDEANAKWADVLLERTESHIRISIGVLKGSEIGISWADQENSFLISLPKGVIPTQSYMLPFFVGNLLNVFDKKEGRQSSTEKKPAPAADDWAAITVDRRTGTAAVVEAPPPSGSTTTVKPQQQPQAPSFDVIPNVETLARPDDLLLKPPYHLIMHSHGETTISVQCSHSPTLQFIANYLKKWSRTNHNNTTRPPCAEIKLHQSAFGLGVVYDRLSIVTESRYNIQAVSPTIVLSLIEGVLGYKSIYSNGSTWTFRKDVEFKPNRY